MNHKKLASRKSAITNRRLGVERLQARELLAGDVTAAVTNGFLVIRGDDAANELTIERISGDRVQVTGATGTTINGLTQPAVLRVRNCAVGTFGARHHPAGTCVTPFMVVSYFLIALRSTLAWAARLVVACRRCECDRSQRAASPLV